MHLFKHQLLASLLFSAGFLFSDIIHVCSECCASFLALCFGFSLLCCCCCLSCCWVTLTLQKIPETQKNSATAMVPM